MYIVLAFLIGLVIGVIFDSFLRAQATKVETEAKQEAAKLKQSAEAEVEKAVKKL